MTLPVIVAVPARNEADHIGACLSALAAQPTARHHLAGVVVFANNCTDDTAAIARAMALPFRLEVIAATLPPDQQHIGHARRGAIAGATSLLASLGTRDAIIAGTDADSRVAPGWLAALVAGFAPGIDAVCGAIDIDEPIAPALARQRRIEGAYADAVAEANAVLDPLPYDPWPNHIWCWGANTAVRASTLAAVGGSPLVDLAEDRALHAALLRADARVRHSLAARVTTSARVVGRAPGGFADLLAGYECDPAALADFALEPAVDTWARAQARGAARRTWGDAAGFGAFWSDYDSEFPRRRVALADLPGETRRLRNLINRAAGRSGIPAVATGRPTLQLAAAQR